MCRGDAAVHRPNASSHSTRHVRRNIDIQRSGLTMRLLLRVSSRRRREEGNGINGIAWGICTQSGTRKDLILILGGSNLQMRSLEVVVLTGARPIAGRAPHAVNSAFCSDMDGGDDCGRHCPAPTGYHCPPSTLSNGTAQTSGGRPLELLPHTVCTVQSYILLFLTELCWRYTGRLFFFFFCLDGTEVRPGFSDRSSLLPALRGSVVTQ